MSAETERLTDRVVDAIAGVLDNWLGAADMSDEGKAAVAWHVAHTWEAAQDALAAALAVPADQECATCKGTGVVRTHQITKIVSIRSAVVCPAEGCVDGRVPTTALRLLTEGAQ